MTMKPVASLIATFALALGLGSGCAAGDDGASGSGGAGASGAAGQAGSAGSGGESPSCSDGVKNGPESDVDCGGLCPKCSDGKDCSAITDCQSSVCEGGTCSAPVCDDATTNGNETDLDCGGAECPKCAVCLRCNQDSDCEPSICQDGLCIPTIEIVSAIYAGNCGAPTPVQTIVDACNGKQTCNYVFNYTVDIGSDPAYGCYKDLKVEYKCSGGTTTKTYYEACAPCDPGNTPTQIKLELECEPCVAVGVPPA